MKVLVDDGLLPMETLRDEDIMFQSSLSVEPSKAESGPTDTTNNETRVIGQIYQATTSIDRP
jgi:hypothetical protein